MLKLAVIGKDVSQSQSPKMHTFLLNKMNVECRYEAVSISPEKFFSVAPDLFKRYDAFNVTIPFKTDIIPYLTEICGDAGVFGAVNTVLCNARAGYNTDGLGFLMMLENAGVEVANKTTLVIGVGGAGRSCIKKLSDAGATVYAYERNFERLKKAHSDLGCFTALKEIPLKPFDIVFNCTGIGMHDTVGKTPEVTYEQGSVKAVGSELLELCGVAVDLIYVPEESEFLRIARQCGKQTVSGGAMLFYQAYFADCIFTGREPHAEEAKEFWDCYRREAR